MTHDFKDDERLAGSGDQGNELGFSGGVEPTEGLEFGGVLSRNYGAQEQGSADLGPLVFGLTFESSKSVVS